MFITGEGDHDPTGLDEEEGLSAQDLVDFSPLYRCLHIFTVLGDKQTFENYYRKQRREQSSLVLQPISNMVIELTYSHINYRLIFSSAT